MLWKKKKLRRLMGAVMCRNGAGGVAVLNWVVRVGVTGVIIFDKGLEGGEEVSHMERWKKNTQGQRRQQGL